MLRLLLMGNAGVENQDPFVTQGEETGEFAQCVVGATGVGKGTENDDGPRLGDVLPEA